MSSVEKKLISRLIHGDVMSFEKVFEKYNRRIYIFSYRYLKNREDAEGIVQEVFIKLWECSHRLKEDSNLNAWLFTVTFNAIKKRFRKLSTEKKHVERYSVSLENQQDGIPEIEYFDLFNIANDYIQKLPPQQKKILILRKEKGLSADEIAVELRLSRKTVENHLNRARAYLKKALIEDGLI